MHNRTNLIKNALSGQKKEEYLQNNLNLNI